MLRRVIRRVVVPATIALLAWPSVASATAITFDLRDPIIETFDEVNSFALTRDGLTAVLTALPATFNEPPLRTVVLNQTASSFGVNVDNTTCGGNEDSALIDGGCIGESIRFVFDSNVIVSSLRVSSFGGTDQGLVTIGGTTTVNITSTGLLSLGNVLLLQGSPLLIAFTAGNGFSLDNVTVNVVPEPMTLLLVGSGLLGVGLRRRHRSGRRSSEPIRSDSSGGV